MSKEEINAFLGAGTVYQGKLSFQGAVRVDGSFSGEIQSEGALIAGKEASIEGRLEVGELILSGSFTGEVIAKRRVTVYKGGLLTGTLITPALVVEEGAIVEGEVRMVNGGKPLPEFNTGMEPSSEDEVEAEPGEEELLRL